MLTEHAPHGDLQIRPYLISDGGNVELSEIDGPVVYLKLQGACGSCPSSMTTMTMGIRRRLMEKIPVSFTLSKHCIAPVLQSLSFTPCMAPTPVSWSNQADVRGFLASSACVKTFIHS